MTRRLRRSLADLMLTALLGPLVLTASAQRLTVPEGRAPEIDVGPVASIRAVPMAPTAISPLTSAPAAFSAAGVAPSPSLEASFLPAAAIAAPPVPAAAAARAAPAAAASSPAANGEAASHSAASGAEARAGSADGARIDSPPDADPDASALFDGASARRALEDAAVSDYTVTVLRRRTGGTTRLAVILGEAHTKSSKAANAGRAVVSRFANYALENYDAESTWARRLNWRMSMHRRASLSRNEPAKFGEGSTINVAWNRVAPLAAAQEYVLSLKPQAREKLIEDARGAVAAGTPGTVALTRGTATIMDAAEILRRFAGAGMPASAHAPATRHVDLEQGHVSDLDEKIAIWKPFLERALPFVIPGAAFGALAGIAASWPALMKASMAVIIPAGLLLLYMMAGEFAMTRWPKSPLGVLFPLETGIIEARDKTMAANLARVVKSAPNDAPWLAVVGKAHVQGMRKRLLASGFEDAGLSALSGE